MKKILFALLIATLLSSCCACNIKYRRDVKPLKGTTWSLIQKDGMAVKTNENYYILISDSGELSGKGDCNQIMGKCEFTPKKHDIKFSSVALSRAMCPNQSSESEFVDMLTRSDTYSIDVRILMLFSKGELLGVFEAR